MITETDKNLVSVYPSSLCRHLGNELTSGKNSQITHPRPNIYAAKEILTLGEEIFSKDGEFVIRQI